MYFSPTDYLRIAPSWAIPTLGVGALIGFGFMHPAVLLVFLDRLRKRRFGAKLVAFVILFSGAIIRILLPDTKTNAILSLLLPCLGVLILLIGAAFFDPISLVARYLFVIVPWSMIFAFSLGYFYEPFDIEEGPLARVLFESEKDRVAGVEGRVIFDLDRYLLLLTENNADGSVVAIPHEKIKSVQIPPLPKEQVSAGD